MPTPQTMREKILAVFKDYHGIVTTGNLQYELGLRGRTLGGIMRSLIVEGIVIRLGRGNTLDTEHGGSTYRLKRKD